MKKTTRIFTLCLLMLLVSGFAVTLAACAEKDKISGTWVDTDGKEYTFEKKESVDSYWYIDENGAKTTLQKRFSYNDFWETIAEKFYMRLYPVGEDGKLPLEIEDTMHYLTRKP